MTNHTTYRASRIMSVLAVLVLAMTLTANVSVAQSLYRTFNQSDLSLKKANVKLTTSTICFTFRNDSLAFAVNSLHIRLSAEVVTVRDSGGFSTLMFGPKRKNIDLSGGMVLPGDSVTLCFVFDKKGAGKHVTLWQWDTSGVFVGNVRGKAPASIEDQTFTNPNGGTLRDYLYKSVIQKPGGLLIGLPTSTPNVGWIRYKTSDRKYFPHSDSSRCFDFIAKGNGGFKRFVGELKNPHVKKHDNHLLGELHALRLAIIANDAGVSDPDTGTALGDLLYNDLSNPSDPSNGLTIREIAHLTDSALTYCANFVSTSYFSLDSSISRINRVFDGPYVAYGKTPLRIKGTHGLADAPFLHPNPNASPAIRQYRQPLNLAANLPGQFELMQNYPNPFNPTTTIDFHLAVPSIVSLKVYNLLGQEVATLLDREQLDEGDQSIDFNAGEFSSGVYFYKIVTQGADDVTQHFEAVKRMILIK